MACNRKNNNDLIAHGFVGTITATAVATVLSVPFVGFGPVLAYCGAAIAVGVGVRLVEDILKNANDKHTKK